jgi:amino acid adenylation domain-containing protein
VGQRAMFFVDQVMAGTAVHNLTGIHRVRGELSRAALGRALCEVVRRHEILRTTFAVRDGDVEQVVAEPADVDLDLTVLDGDASEREAALRRLAEAEARWPFDLATGPLLRARLVRLHQRDHALLLTIHHIVADGWSLGVLTLELSRLYNAHVTGVPAELEEPAQYGPYALAQRERLSTEALNRAVAYWRERLRGAPDALELPTDRPRPASPSFRGEAVQFQVPPALQHELQELSRRHRTTLFTTLLTAFQLLLGRVSGQDDVVVGAPFVNRGRQERGLIGLVTNTLPLRADLRGSPRFVDLLAAGRAAMLGALAHQALPFERIVEELQPGRGQSWNWLLQVLFQLNPPGGRLTPTLPAMTRPDHAAHPVAQVDGGDVGAGGGASGIASAATPFDLSLTMDELAEGGLAGRLIYSADLFDPASAERLARRFPRLLEAIAAEPERPARELPIMDDEELRQVTTSWNAPSACSPAHARCLHELFEAEAGRRPHAVAASFEGEHLTYGELDRRANRLARHLRHRGAGPESLIGVCLERSFDLVVTLLAVLKAGAAYVPLDPGYPQGRLAFLLEDSGARLVVTRRGLLDRLAAGSGAGLATVCLDADHERIAVEACGARDSGAGPDHLAYVIYTSGSTGRPKGAMNSHRGIVNRLLWMRDALPLTEADHVLHKTPTSFDVSVWELFAPLLSGARLVVARPGGHADPAYLADVIAGEGVTVAQFVPPMLAAFLDQPDLRERCRSLRHIVCSGETLPAELQRRCLARLDARLHNLYGPTEAAVEVTAWTCRPDDNHGTVPIGRPIDNTHAYVLDAGMEPVPVGSTGELFLGGVQVCRGYLGRPGLTAERFLPDPFAAVPGGRAYRTGDRCRWSARGQLEFLGRLDHQVKINGIRIELGEIEDALTRHPAVREAAVVVHGDAADDRHLVAYVTSTSGRALDRALLRAHLAGLLPVYLVPSGYVVLEALPRTPSGKLDRSALPAPERSRAAGPPAFVAPRNRIERAIAEIWAEVLGLERVGVTDDLFDLGGHSFTALRLAASIPEVLGRPVTVTEILQFPTVEGLAALLNSGASAEDHPIVPIRRTGSRRPVFCVHPLGGGVSCYAALARRLGVDRPVLGLVARGLDGDAVREARIEDMAARYVEALVSSGPGPYAVGGWSMGGIVAFEMALQLRRRGEAVEGLFLLDSRVSAPGVASRLADDAVTASWFAQDWGLTAGRPLDVAEEELAGLSRTERVRLLLERAGAAGVLTAGIGAAEVDRMLAVFQANARALAAYRPAERCDVPLLVVRAADGPPDGTGHALGWDDWTHGGVEARVVPGRHHEILREPHVAAAATVLDEWLATPAV